MVSALDPTVIQKTKKIEGYFKVLFIQKLNSINWHDLHFLVLIFLFNKDHNPLNTANEDLQECVVLWFEGKEEIFG